MFVWEHEGRGKGKHAKPRINTQKGLKEIWHKV